MQRNDTNYYFILEQFENFNSLKRKAIMSALNELKEEYNKNNIKFENIDNIVSCYELDDDEIRCPETLKRILWFNLFEYTISAKYYQEMFYEFLKRCG